MTQLKSLVRFTGCTAIVLLLASACGGKSFVSNGDDDDDNGGSSAQGGSTSQAGKSNKAGKGQGGSSTTGGTIGTGGTGNVGGVATAGTAGVAGYSGEECTAPPVSGQCDAYFPAWYHDPSTGICRPFVYGGCGGNPNRYGSLAECQKACQGGTPNYDACTQNSDCTVTGTGCCGVCDSPDLTAHDLIAYNKQYAGLLQCNYALDLAPPGSGATAPVACAPCPPVAGGAMKYFVPQCVQKQCVVTDLRNSPVTACKTSDECKVRYGTSCCEGCGGGDLIGTRNDGSFEKLVCGGAPTPCPACLPQPTNAVPYCSALGRCDVGYPLDAAQ